MFATLIRKGQFTLPKDLRDRLNLDAGASLDFQTQADYTITARHALYLDSQAAITVDGSPAVTLPGVTKVEQTQGPEITTLRVYAGAAASLVGAAVNIATEAGARIHDLSVKNATLEEVFIYLTGRQLR